MRKTCKWALKFSNALPGDVLMAQDQRYYSAFHSDTHLPLLHLYTWQRPSLSIGRYQTLSSELQKRAETLKIPMVRRPTGGQGILHTQDLTWSLVAPVQQQSLIENYRHWAQLHLKALEALGVQAHFGESAQAYKHQSSCFQILNAGDVYVEYQGQKKKLLGAAQMRRRGALLQQQLIYLTLPEQELRNVFGKIPEMMALNDFELPDAQALSQSVFTPMIRKLMPENIRAQQFIENLIQVYCTYFESEPQILEGEPILD